MKDNKTLLFGLIGLAVAGGITAFAIEFSTNGVGEYCSTDGTLTEKRHFQSHRAYCMKSASPERTYAENTPSEYTYSIIDDRSKTLKEFAITHTKPMHVIVVRKDLTYFQHLHPEFDQLSSQFTLKNIVFPANGQYRIFSDFAVGGGENDHAGTPPAITLSQDVVVGSEYTPEPIGTEETVKTFEGYQVAFTTHGTLQSGQASMLMFAISENSKSVTNLEQYLGALGHSVILKENTLDFIHAHPMENNSPQNGSVNFMVTFPTAGKYKLFTQFQKDGKVFTTDFVVTVVRGTGSGPVPVMEHSTH